MELKVNLGFKAQISGVGAIMDNQMEKNMEIEMDALLIEVLGNFRYPTWRRSHVIYYLVIP